MPAYAGQAPTEVVQATPPQGKPPRATPPQATLTIERALAFSFQARISPSARIAPIKIGTSQSEA